MRWTLLIACLSVALASGATAADPVTVVLNVRSMQPGELVVVTVTTLEPADVVGLRVFERDFPAYRTGPLKWQALVGIDLEVAPRAYTAVVHARLGPRILEATHSVRVLPKRFPTRLLKVDPDFVTPPAAMEARILREAAELESIWSQPLTERLWQTPFVAPVRRTATSAFGSRSVFNGVARSPHSGADFPSASGTPIVAPNAGQVVLAKDLYFSGNTVVLDHGLGLFSLLAHLSAIDVRHGDRVTAGQTIGKVGATGRVTGPHLHWAVRLAGARIDPVAVLELLGKP
jgi:murein DD-endopeptidase MepM/ murein hydrolase activator NlpD